MYKIKDFFSELSKSTRITVLSCGIFVILTFIILLFFVLFPITPSEKIISGLGREALISSENNNQQNSTSNIEGVVITTTATETALPRVTSTYVTKQKVTYTDKVFTIAEGYVYTGYAVPTGEPGYESGETEETVTTTTSEYWENSTPDITTEPPTDENGNVVTGTEPSTDVTIEPGTDTPSTDIEPPSEELPPIDVPSQPDEPSSEESSDSEEPAVPDTPVTDAPVDDPPIL